MKAYLNIIYRSSLLILLFQASNQLSAQSLVWENTIGGLGHEWLFSAELTADGNHLLGGYSYSDISGDKTENSEGQNDMWLLKLNDTTGDIIWQETIGGSGRDYATSSKETSDGGYILGGYSNSNISGDKSENGRGGDDYWVVRLDVNRNILWDKTYGGSGTDRLTSILETSDGGFIMIGDSDSDISGDKSENSRGLIDIWLIKIDSNGLIQWQKTYGGNDFDTAGSIISSNDNGFIITSTSGSNISGEKSENSRGLGDYWIIKINDLGAIQWQRTMGGNNGEHALNCVATSDGNFVVAGDSFSSISGEKSENSVCNSNDIWLIKIDPSGAILWDKTIGGDSTEWMPAIKETNDNNLIIGCMSSSGISGYKTELPRGDRDYWMFKVDLNGNLIWDKSYGGSEMDQLTTIVASPDGSYVLGGWSTSPASSDKTENSNGGFDYWMIKDRTSLDNYTSANYSSQSYCEGDDIQLNSTSGASYKWSGPNNFTSTLQNPVILNASTLYNGVYNLAVADNSGCVEVFIIQIEIAPVPMIPEVEDLYQCDDDGFAIFDLESVRANIVASGFTSPMSFYSENGQLITPSNLNAYHNLIVDEETITIRVDHTTSECTVDQMFKIIASTPVAHPANSITACDNSNSGFSSNFNLTALETVVLNGQIGVTITYYDSNGDLIPNSRLDNYTNLISNRDFVTIRVSSPLDLSCFDETKVDLMVEAPPLFNPIDDLEGCDYNRNGFSSNFDTSTVASDLLNGQVGIEISYYDENGRELPNPLPNPYTNSIASQETISVRLSKIDNPDCFVTGTFNLNTIMCENNTVVFPQFFTPNGDGYHDTWPYEISTHLKSLYIYDRFGKLITVVNENTGAWDGNYKGEPLPSNDYWFRAVILDDQMIKGHFSLKR